MTTYYTTFDSRIDPILLTSDGEALTGLYMTQHKYGPEIAPDWVRSDETIPFVEAKRQLAAYFAGALTEFDLPLAPQGTEFQRRVWTELPRIAYGGTISYGELARRIGQPGSARAVGLANGRNPISIVVPCHRVIGANGKLVGYGGGLPRKQALLSHEAAGGLGGGGLRYATCGAASDTLVGLNHRQLSLSLTPRGVELEHRE